MTEASGEHSTEIGDNYMMAGTSRSNQTSTIIDVTKLVSSIEGKLRQTSPILSKCSIFRVPYKLRRHNKQVFEPELVSIGPFHHRKKKLQSLQKIKLWYLHCLLSRAETTLKCFVEIIGNIEKECRACYAGEIGFDKKEFIEMMVIDGCFIIEFCFRISSNEVQQEEDPIFNNSLMTLQIRNDLLLLENQLPWRVLELLYIFSKSNAQQRSLTNLVSCLLTDLVTPDHNVQSKHLLDFLRNSFVGSFRRTSGVNGDQFKCPNRDPIPSAEELQQAGVNFETGDENNMLSVTFNLKNRVMTIPPICIVENTESVFRNLVAFEQCDSSQDHKISSYAALLHDLIRTSEDVDFLKQRGILNIFLSTEDTTSFFNRLGSDAGIHGNYFLYSDLYHEVHAYCRKPWSRYRAVLIRDYFGKPMAIVSFLFSILGLYLTFLQTFKAFAS